MANAVVTSDAIVIKTEFNDLDPITGYTTGWYGRDKIESVRVDNQSDTVQVFLLSGKVYIVSLNGNNGSLIVDSVNGVTPTDTEHLAELIVGLMI
jgi:hypothetical protein